MTKAKFHSFVKLVRLMHNTQQECYKSRNNDKNLVAKAKQLEKKVGLQLIELKSTPIYYEWQALFLHIVKSTRAEQAMYYATKYIAVLERCQALEKRLGDGILHIEKHNPEVFQEELHTKQASLYD